MQDRVRCWADGPQLAEHFVHGVQNVHEGLIGHILGLNSFVPAQILLSVCE